MLAPLKIKAFRLRCTRPNRIPSGQKICSKTQSILLTIIVVHKSLRVLEIFIYLYTRLKNLSNIHLPSYYVTYLLLLMQVERGRRGSRRRRRCRLWVLLLHKRDPFLDHQRIQSILCLKSLCTLVSCRILKDLFILRAPCNLSRSCQ